ncbi:MAG: FMN-binding protein [Ilumatobacteraceae bacterium]|nr:FMN-binding protein [Ilumatobacteraceae bacterium]
MSLTATAGLSAYFQHTDSVGASSTTNSVTGVAVAVATPPAAAAAPNASPSATAASTTPAAASTNTTSALADGTYAGATATNKYGPVQVQITVAGGKITDVVALQTPTGDRKSISINDRATPTLVSEALSAQSANVDTVSGATYTTDSYKISLQSAIDLAHATTVQSSATS